MIDLHSLRKGGQIILCLRKRNKASLDVQARIQDFRPIHEAGSSIEIQGEQNFYTGSRIIRIGICETLDCQGPRI